MAVGVFSGRLNVTTAASLDSFTGGTQTYSVLVLRKSSGAISIGNSGVTATNGFILKDIDTLTMSGGGIVGANIFLLGPGVVDFFGNSTA